MDRLNPDCWVWSPQTPLCVISQHSGNIVPAMLSHQEVEEEDEEVVGHPGTSFCYITGCDDVITHTDVAHWSISESPLHLDAACGSDLTVQDPSAPSSQRSKSVIDAEGGDTSQHLIDGCSWGSSGRVSQGCVCVHGQREQEGVAPCWPGTPYVYYGVRRNLVVGVEVVEEVAVEDTLEVITEDVYTDDLMDAELLHDSQLYPT